MEYRLWFLLLALILLHRITLFFCRIRLFRCLILGNHKLYFWFHLRLPLWHCKNFQNYDEFHLLDNLYLIFHILEILLEKVWILSSLLLVDYTRHCGNLVFSYLFSKILVVPHLKNQNLCHRRMEISFLLWLELALLWCQVRPFPQEGLHVFLNELPLQVKVFLLE